MANLLCTKELQHFINKTTTCTISEMPAFISYVSLQLPPVARVAHIAQIDLQLSTPSSPQNPVPGSFEHSFRISGKNENAQPFVKNYETGERGNFHLTAYPEENYVFTPDDTETAEFIMDIIFMVLGRARMSSLLNEVAVTDGMTGVPNVAGFMRFGNILTAKNTLQYYLGIFLNIKNFKFINQTIGPRNGDKLLTAFAQHTKQQLDSEEMIARLGGDNFMILVKKTHEKEFLHFLNTIQLKINIGTTTRLFDINVRAGIYKAEPETSMNDMMANANTALNIARGAVKEDIVYFRSEMKEASLHQKRVSNQFHLALQNREFVVYYQPKVDLTNNTLCGAEALVRWLQDGRIVPPMSFIPILEQEGSVCELDFYVFEQLCSDLRAWLDAGITPVRISSNFSKVHLLSDSLASDILNIMEKYEIPGKYIEIELTEMSGHDDKITLGRFVDTMKAHGIHTSIDDFGTGYSSVNLLKDLNVDVIKLDKSFLNDMELRTNKEEIVIRNIVNMIRELGMQVIAEGVETKGQAEFLKGINCLMAQGYLYDKPIPHDDFEERLLNRVYER